ncbi:MAG: HlyD family efflux transporter periplasmic adaptor subunit, partial [Planctomycetota bacterium]
MATQLNQQTAVPPNPGADRSTAKAAPQYLQRSIDLSKSIRLIESSLPATGTADRVKGMLESLQKELPQSQIRCGLGNKKLEKLLDARLGWLPPTSEVYSEFARQWTIREPRFDSPPTQRPIQLDEICVDLDDAQTRRRCRLIVRGGPLTSESRDWIHAAAPTLRTVLWSPKQTVVDRSLRRIRASGVSTRLYIALAIAGLCLISMWPVPYRIRSGTVVRPSMARVVSAPFDATLLSVHAKPGDRVREGDPLFELDGRPLRLELESITAQIGQAQKEQDIALVGGRVAESQQAALKVRELSRRGDLIRRRLGQLAVASPIDGIVVAGELVRSIGTPLQMGESIMEIASLDSMQVELEIPEYDVGFIRPGQETRLRFPAVDGEVFETS